MPFVIACHSRPSITAIYRSASYVDISLLDTSLHEATGVGTFVIVLSALYMAADRQALRRAFS